MPEREAEQTNAARLRQFDWTPSLSAAKLHRLAQLFLEQRLRSAWSTPGCPYFLIELRCAEWTILRYPSTWLQRPLLARSVRRQSEGLELNQNLMWQIRLSLLRHMTLTRFLQPSKHSSTHSPVRRQAPGAGCDPWR